MKAETWQ